MGKGITMAAPQRGRTVGREESEVDDSTYAGRLAVRIRSLRKSRGWTVDKLAKLITRAGYKVSTPNLYAWENGRIEPQLNAVPAITKAFRMDSIADLLPPE